jgi:hypothetical protein
MVMLPCLHPELHSKSVGAKNLDLEYQHRVWPNSPGWKATGSIGVIWGALQQGTLKISDAQKLHLNNFTSMEMIWNCKRPISQNSAALVTLLPCREGSEVYVFKKSNAIERLTVATKCQMNH